MSDLFAIEQPYRPLADRMRPISLKHYVGQQHLLGEGKPLRKAIESDLIHSMILWGPPGVGKTSLARLIANETKSQFVSLSAIMSGVKDIRAAVEQAQQAQLSGRKTILFVDEVHRFNKSQQDAFLPYIENGTFVFIGATTENPSFELNNALLSRTRVYRLTVLQNEELRQLLELALADKERGLGELQLAISNEAAELLIQACGGDSRKLLNFLEIASDFVAEQPEARLDVEHVREVIGEQVRHFDKGGDLFYDQISALHKAVRGSDPDAALYWFCRMLDGGCDPLYIARRVVRMASEEVGNADPRALSLALDAWQVQERLGSPEGELAVAQAICFVASAAKSNAVYKAYGEARALVANDPGYEVPMHLKNAPTRLMKQLGYGKEYRYSHDEADAFSAGQSYWPEGMDPVILYKPVPRGLEIQIKEKLARLRELNKQAK
jgi:putative ATPase